MTERPFRGPADWLRDNAFILTLASVVAVAVIGDRVARSGISPADDPRFAAAAAQPAGKPDEMAAQDADADPAGEKVEPAQHTAGAPDHGAAVNGGSSQEATATSPPAAPAEKSGPGKQQTAPDDTPEKK